MYAIFGKRWVDVCGVLIALVVLSPLFFLVILLIKLFDPGPIFFSQNRVGRNGQEFLFYKFRSMPVNTGDIPSDKLGSVKLTLVGRMIRRTNLDELPQLYNIFKGDMSFVGPRPPIQSQSELIALRKANGSLSVRPGLTGLAQINSFDGMTVEEKAKFDGTYAERVTLLADVKIVLGTFGYLLKPPPVY